MADGSTHLDNTEMMNQFYVAMGYLVLKDVDTSRYDIFWGYARVVKDLHKEEANDLHN